MKTNRPVYDASINEWRIPLNEQITVAYSVKDKNDPDYVYSVIRMNSEYINKTIVISRVKENSKADEITAAIWKEHTTTRAVDALYKNEENFDTIESFLEEDLETEETKEEEETTYF